MSLITSLFGDLRGPDMGELAKIARQSPAGLSKDTIIPGLFVTISPNKGTGDRSWTNEVWTVIGVSGPFVAMAGLAKHRQSNAPVIVNSLEHEFYDAHEMAQAMAAEVKP